MSNEQRDQQQPQAPAPQADSRREFAKKGALAAIGSVVSAAARFGTEAVLGAVFREGS